MFSIEVNETWKEVALTQLLTLVDLTFLDGILSEEKRSRQQNIRENCIITNLMASNWYRTLTPSILVPVNVRDRDTDLMLQCAMDCIECLPQGYFAARHF